MTGVRRMRLYEPLSDAELQERLSLTILEWMRATGWGMDEVAMCWKIVGRGLVAEHLIRGLDPDTGKPFRTTT